MHPFLWVLIILALIGLVGFAVSLFTKRRQTTPFLLLQQQLQALQTELREQAKGQLDLLEKSHQGIGQRLDNASKFFGGMESKMVKVEEAARQVLELGKEVADLQQILKAPKLRGNFSEQLLGDLLSQMMSQENFILQYTFENGERVDAVIKTAQRLVPIDAKFPLENFRRYVESKTEEEKALPRRLFVQDVRRHIDDIAKKYILPQEGTFEFALMYIPAENVYYEIVTKDIAAGETISIVDYALRKHVIPVSPNTFYAYLQTILLGLRGMQVQKRVREILQEMGGVRKDLTSFRIDFSKLGGHLRDALSSFEKSDKRLTRLEDKMASLDVAPKEPVIEKSSEEQALLEQ